MDKMFVTNQYRVLEAIYENTVSVGGEEYCPLGQGEVAENLGISRMVANNIYSELKNAGYVSMKTRGKWKLTEKAVNFIQATQDL